MLIKKKKEKRKSGDILKSPGCTFEFMTDDGDSSGKRVKRQIPTTWRTENDFLGLHTVPRVMETHTTMPCQQRMRNFGEVCGTLVILKKKKKKKKKGPTLALLEVWFWSAKHVRLSRGFVAQLIVHKFQYFVFKLSQI